MSRGLTAPDIQALEQERNFTEEHVKITVLDANTPPTAGYTTFTTYRYTTGPIDAVVASDGTYLKESFITSLDRVVESYELRPQEVAVEFQTFTQSLFDNLNRPSCFSNQIEIYKVLRSRTDFSVTARFLMFKGTQVGLELDAGRDTQRIILRCANQFRLFTKAKGRRLADLPQQNYVPRISWGNVLV